MEFSMSGIVLLVIVCLALYGGGAEASHHEFEEQANDNVKMEHRTGYHFQPMKNWINDPNGPMFYKGIYHLFYQYNPKGATWGNIVWAHSVSSDLINWKRLENAIYPSKKFDQYGCWSGSATILPGNKPIILYTGIVDHNNTQVQNYAVPADLSDPYLRKWIKPDDNPLIHADESINMTFFRDPTTAWFVGGHWRIAIGGRRKRRGVAYMYRSKDFKHWVKAQHPLHSTNGTGNWECPDFYPVSVMHREGLETSARPGPHVKHVLKVSLDINRHEYYTLGTYNVAKDRYFPDEGMVDGLNGLRYDYGNFYASKSFYDPAKHRRILWGWANESDTTDNDIDKGWAGIQLIPRTIELDPNGKQLVQWPIEEVESLRAKNATGLFNWELSKGEKFEIKGITPAQADVEVTFSFDSLEKVEAFNSSWDRYDAQKLCGQKNSTVEGALGPFGIITLASQSWEEYTPVYFRIFKDRDQHKHLLLMCSDASRSSLKDPKTQMKDGIDAYRPSFGGFVDVDLEERKISLRTLIDNSVVESFAARGKLCITSRVYPQMALDANAHLFVFNNGTEKLKIESLNAWSMKRPVEMNQ